MTAEALAPWTRRAVLSALLAFLLVWGLTWSQAARAQDWHGVDRPSVGAPLVIGSYSKGCIGGAVRLPERGPGFETIRMSRSRFWGHPQLIDFVERLGRAVERERIGIMLIGDLSQPRGGPMPWGHASHQIGLDADIWFRLTHRRLTRSEREDVEEIPLVDYRTWAPTTAWEPGHTRMLQLAATDPRVDRIFINPGIKKHLCDMRWSDRAWLRKLRPWWGHAAHFHVRLACPAGSEQCTDQAPPPPGDGCGALAWWFAQRDKTTTTATTKPTKRVFVLPEACDAVYAAEARPERAEALLAAIIPPRKPTVLQR